MASPRYGAKITAVAAVMAAVRQLPTFPHPQIGLVERGWLDVPPPVGGPAEW
jgi:hypothetical protein